MTNLSSSSTPVLPETDSGPFWSEWLPTRVQMENALRLRIDTPPEPGNEGFAIPRDSVLYASMRQGMGMVIVAAILAGLLPFLWNWITAARMGASVPLAQMQQGLRALPILERAGADSLLSETFRTVAGLEPAVFPGWMAAGLSALGIWVSTPLQWLTWWIAYGLAVLLVAKMLGATTTLQQFYTLTSFGFLPLILTGLGPIPCLGPVAVLAALVWAVAVYVSSVRSATRLSLGLSLLVTVVPAATLALLSVVAAIATAVAVAGLAW